MVGGGLKQESQTKMHTVKRPKLRGLWPGPEVGSESQPVPESRVRVHYKRYPRAAIVLGLGWSC